MPIYNPDVSNLYAMPTLQQGSALGGVLSDAIAKRLAMAKAEQEEVASKYAERNALSNALKAELENKHKQQENEWYVPNIKSEIGYRNAGAGHLGAETRKINSLLPYDIAKARDAIEEIKRSHALQQQIQNAISGGSVAGTSPTPSNIPTNNPASPISNAPLSYTPISNAGMSNAPMSNAPISNTPSVKQNANENVQEKIINPGSQNLSQIDDLYSNNPMARSALEKMGFKKTQQIKIDKAGNPTIVTRYPSGKITVQSSIASDEGVPLTTKMISQHQNVVSSVDVAVPVLDKIIALKNDEYSRAGGWTTKGAKYQGLVKQALDSVLGAFGLPQTNEGIKSILDQLEIGHGESREAYRKRMIELKKDIIKRQKYSAGLVKKSIKNTENNNENESDPYNLDEYDNAGEQ